MKRAALALVICVSLILAGCSTDWAKEAEQIVATMIPAAANLVALVAALEGKSISSEDLQLIQNAGAQAGMDLQLIQALMAAYPKADRASKPGILQKIETAIGTVQGNLQGLLGALHIKDAATQAKVTAVVGLLLAEVQSLAALVPVVKAGPATAELGHPGVSSDSKAPLSAGQFASSYNSTMTARTGNVQLDRAAAGLKIPERGVVARVTRVLR